MTDSLLVEALAKLAPNTIIAFAVALFLRAVTPKITDFLAHLTVTLAAHDVHHERMDVKLDNITALQMLQLQRQGVPKDEIAAVVKAVPAPTPPPNARRSYSGAQPIVQQRTGTNG